LARRKMNFLMFLVMEWSFSVYLKDKCRFRKCMIRLPFHFEWWISKLCLFENLTKHRLFWIH
jgi:hypothetical protein